MRNLTNLILRTLALSGRQGVCGGETEGWWWACPLEGCVRRVASPQRRCAELVVQFRRGAKGFWFILPP